MVRRLYKMYDQDVDECYKNIMEIKKSYRKVRQDPKEKRIDDKFYKDFGERICQLRLKMDMSQTDLGKKCYKNVTGHAAAMFICDIENGKRRNISIYRLSIIAKVLDTTIDYLVYGKE